MVKSRRIDGVHDEISGVPFRDYGKMMLRSSRTGRYRVRGLALRGQDSGLQVGDVELKV